MNNDQSNVVMVKLSLALLSSFAGIGALSGSADDVLPPRFSFDRYTAMVDQSPFAIATAAALPEATPDFAKDLYIANAARSPEGDVVTIRSSSDQNFKKYLSTREPVDGYSIASIEWSNRVGATKVTISKDGKFATLMFNQVLLSKLASGNPLAPSQMPRSGPFLSSSGADQDDRAGVHTQIQPTPEVVIETTPNFVPRVTAQQEQLLMQQLLQQSDEKPQLQP